MCPCLAGSIRRSQGEAANRLRAAIPRLDSARPFREAFRLQRAAYSAEERYAGCASIPAFIRPSASALCLRPASSRVGAHSTALRWPRFGFCTSLSAARSGERLGLGPPPRSRQRNSSRRDHTPWPESTSTGPGRSYRSRHFRQVARSMPRAVAASRGPTRSASMLSRVRDMPSGYKLSWSRDKV